MSRRDGDAPTPSSAARRRTMPGVQKPHWLAPCSTNAAAQRSRSSAGAPSRVVTRRPATRRTGVTQATRGAPSTHTVQQPHWHWGLQPSFTDRQPSSSRSASRRLIPSSTATASPLRTNDTSLGAGAPKDGGCSGVLPAPLRGRGARSSAEGGAAAAGAGGVGVDDVEAGALEAVAVLERRPGQQLGAGRVHDHLDGAELAHHVVGHDLGVEEHLVAVAGAATGLDGNSKGKLLALLLGQQFGDLRRGAVAERHRCRLLPDVDGSGHRRHWILLVVPTPGDRPSGVHGAPRTCPCYWRRAQPSTRAGKGRNSLPRRYNSRVWPLPSHRRPCRGRPRGRTARSRSVTACGRWWTPSWATPSSISAWSARSPSRTATSPSA